MENKEIDQLAKTILVQSKLEITDPDFTRNLMGRIQARSRKRVLLQKGLFYAFLFIALDTIILSLFKILGIHMTDLTGSIEMASSEIVAASSKGGNMLFFYFLIQTLAVLIMMRIWGPRSKVEN